jgi:hypothetical protein
LNIWIGITVKGSSSHWNEMNGNSPRPAASAGRR